MEYAELGSTGLEVSVVSLGAGGASKLGLGTGKSASEAEELVETALDLGITTIDTAEAYGTEDVIGAAIEDVAREDLVLSTKVTISDGDERRTPDDLEASLRGSLDRLGTDYVDVYHLHGVHPDDYEYAVETLYPRMERLQDAGLLRFAGITETVSRDPGHEMLRRAVDDGVWDVVMVGFNLLNHSARERVLEPAASQGIGTICMVAVRRALSDPAALEETIRELVESGTLDPTEVDPEDPFGFLVHDEGADDLIDAAYRFARHEPTVDTVLTGTSNRDHLVANIESASKPPLPDADLARLDEQFGHVDSVLGN
jgi:aryl-alcohol dehydrogenase-like predicted oxidoreductase